MDDRAWKEEEERGPESFNLREGEYHTNRAGRGVTCQGKVFFPSGEILRFPQKTGNSLNIRLHSKGLYFSHHHAFACARDSDGVVFTLEGGELSAREQRERMGRG